MIEYALKTMCKLIRLTIIIILEYETYQYRNADAVTFSNMYIFFTSILIASNAVVVYGWNNKTFSLIL